MRKLEFATIAVICALVLSMPAFGAAIGENQARQAVSNWLYDKSDHFDENLGLCIETVKKYQGGQAGDIGYYLVILKPSGWVIVPADDRYSPIQSFGSGKMTLDSFEGSFWHKITRFGGASGSSAKTLRATSTGKPGRFDKK
jgi:hypothetical protein